MLHRMRECTRSLIHSGGTASQLSTRMMMPTGTGSTKESDVVSLPGGAFGIALRQLRYVLTLKLKAFSVMQFLQPPCLMTISLLIYLHLFTSTWLYLIHLCFQWWTICCVQVSSRLLFLAKNRGAFFNLVSILIIVTEINESLPQVKRY